MSSNNQIRIVKRAEREQQAEQLEAKLDAARETPKEKARDTAVTVTGWIVEQQEEQSTGGARADFDKLFEVSR